MAENRHRHDAGPDRVPGSLDAPLIPSTDHDRPIAAEPSAENSPRWREPRGIQKGIAEADKMARTGSTKETVRNTPPAGDWNETSGD